jgi:hypothetical protein
MLRGILILFSIDEVSSCGDVNILFLHLCSMTFMLGLTGVALDEDALRLDPGVPSFPLMGGRNNRQGRATHYFSSNLVEFGGMNEG